MYAIDFFEFVALDSFISYFIIEEKHRNLSYFHEKLRNICSVQNAIVTEMYKIPQKIFKNVSVIFARKLCEKKTFTDGVVRLIWVERFRNSFFNFVIFAKTYF